jgi:E3 ubiquitin-protein ligase RGLG
MSREISQAEKEDQFALQALTKIPAQYSAIIDKWIRYVSDKLKVLVQMQ